MKANQSINEALKSCVQLILEYPDGFANGTGFFVDGDGHILTAGHVVQERSGERPKILVKHQGLVLGVAIPVSVQRELASDLALLKLNEAPETPFIGRFSGVSVGQNLITLGYPVSRTSVTPRVTTGFIVSDPKARPCRLNGAADPIQGTSGGPVLDGDGGVVGVWIGKSPTSDDYHVILISTILAFCASNGVILQKGKEEEKQASALVVAIHNICEQMHAQDLKHPPHQALYYLNQAVLTMLGPEYDVRSSMTIKNQQGQLEFRGQFGTPPIDVDPPLPFNSISGYCLREQKIVFLEDRANPMKGCVISVDSDRNFQRRAVDLSNHYHPRQGDNAWHSLLCIPVTHRRLTFGVLAIDCNRIVSFHGVDFPFLQACGRIFAGHVYSSLMVAKEHEDSTALAQRSRVGGLSKIAEAIYNVIRQYLRRR